ncbi:hypothetical protein VN12_07580 [Pirellula sp. SH-Sr6A]|uniref:DUF2834 domain-containing protein n=1 Tax=Pirellula sp. SH-Sr6A TaxID=1632865 RepID=UPI00078E928B|nr:DUF2834 domain-containing protein [Pirellula sp. SH-Sr6A]AMV31966.1 hypothetical protein VN12_07580 [Pirellula sp. SH-Sr6A]
MRILYLILSILGFIAPMVCFGVHFGSRGETAWSEFFAAPYATWVISGFSWDLMVTATAATLWMHQESKRLRMKGFIWHLLLIFAVGVCFSLPTFLYRREKHLRHLPNVHLPKVVAPNLPSPN